MLALKKINHFLCSLQADHSCRNTNLCSHSLVYAALGQLKVFCYSMTSWYRCSNAYVKVLDLPFVYQSVSIKYQRVGIDHVDIKRFRGIKQVAPSQIFHEHLVSFELLKKANHL